MIVVLVVIGSVLTVFESVLLVNCLILEVLCILGKWNPFLGNEEANVLRTVKAFVNVVWFIADVWSAVLTLGVEEESKDVAVVIAGLLKKKLGSDCANSSKGVGSVEDCSADTENNKK